MNANSIPDREQSPLAAQAPVRCYETSNALVTGDALRTGTVRGPPW